ncbi:hypothetical protein PQ469_24400 [Mucilaginibacter sp. KACC 22773]|uniref:hypothetical protein n=1 Tax=Mucilaginibacter sp. KACC 22773 TaxID=3025671 RepID=UPI0023672404|nr:hypothetical protein [Mucilaginibacter sp. KACC 22773]WDF77028.1 hypothetical protein PQ469_24400 [Mucilaginibacter sp. KACC 22773]
MKDDFYDFVAVELQNSLPDSRRIFYKEKTPEKEFYSISHAFVALTDGKKKLVNIVVLPLSLDLNPENKEQLLTLRDDLIFKDALLIVINEETAEMRLGNTGVFISEKLLIHCPNFIWINCSREKKSQMTFDGIHYEDLRSGFAKIWNTTVTYAGPMVGFQSVNLEIMRSTCWKCQREIKTVTGIVFPNRQLNSWNDVTWQYYHSLVSLNQIKGNTADLIAEFVATLRQHDKEITPVGYKYSNTIKSSYFAASCSYCDALFGNFYVMDERMDYLHSLGSRVDGSLTYHSITLNVDRYLIQCVFDSSEACDHTTDAGWGSK